ncbi:uncharacterized protein LOC110607681 [Manihot esculenta]|uniref:Uncharacterized protein n=2 Tax=Manihot esculenta TaxID=3983 RepID=A0ACB7G6M2_MANES|nr:uncharacterized protein LOC110607681 [Manihot esculenta]KAG8634361.1 hypothetical protein MANES_17G038980v8 [Manihot esculenta]
MADWHGLTGKGSTAGGYIKRSMKDEDFEEEDVWSVMKDREDSSPEMMVSKDYFLSSPSSSSSSAWRLPSAPRMIPRANIANQLTAAATTHEVKIVEHSSAPVNIPDWSKIYGKNTRIHSSADDGEHPDNECYRDDVNDNDDGEGDEMVPPHEWIARKLARSQISSSSVYEGIGRTLKGRDLSKVRNAILAKTGFLE